MSGSSSVLLVIDFICICVGLAGIIAGGVGHSWWKTDINIGVVERVIETGLWRTCTTTDGKVECQRRNDILDFDNREKLDIILVLLIGATALALLNLITVASMCCCQKSRGAWFCGCVIAAIAGLFTGLASLGGLIYCEVEIEWVSGQDRGWSVIATWIGAAMSLLSFILALVLCCLVPKRPNTSYIQTGYAMR